MTLPKWLAGVSPLFSFEAASHRSRRQQKGSALRAEKAQHHRQEERNA